jgi:hypothetical protein
VSHAGSTTTRVEAAGQPTTPAVDGQDVLPVTVTGIADEDLTWVKFDYAGKTWRFTVQGREMPYEVSYLQDFGTPGHERQAFFTIAPETAADPQYLEQQLYTQLVAIHEHELRQRVDTQAR